MCKIKGDGTAARKNPVCTLGWHGTAFFLRVPRRAHPIDAPEDFACRVRRDTLDYGTRVAIEMFSRTTCTSVSERISDNARSSRQHSQERACAAKSLRVLIPKGWTNVRLLSGAILRTPYVARSILEFLVESRCGAVAVGSSQLLPPLSVGGAAIKVP